MDRAREFRLVLALKLVHNCGWRNGHLAAFAEVALTDNMIVKSESFSHLELIGFHKWEDLMDIPEKKLGILVVETYEYLGDYEKAFDSLKSLIEAYPTDQELKSQWKKLEKTMQTLRRADPA